jgi:hypothetical protein
VSIREAQILRGLPDSEVPLVLRGEEGVDDLSDVQPRSRERCTTATGTISKDDERMILAT